MIGDDSSAWGLFLTCLGRFGGLVVDFGSDAYFLTGSVIDWVIGWMDGKLSFLDQT